MSEWCQHLRWVEDPSGDYYCCALGHDTSADWCEDIAFGGQSECTHYSPVKHQ